MEDVICLPWRARSNASHALHNRVLVCHTFIHAVPYLHPVSVRQRRSYSSHMVSIHLVCHVDYSMLLVSADVLRVSCFSASDNLVDELERTVDL